MPSNNTNTNPKVVPSAKNALEKMKLEIAAELGIDMAGRDLGDLTTREVGRIGGNMTKRLVAYAEQALAQQEARPTMMNDVSLGNEQQKR